MRKLYFIAILLCGFIANAQTPISLNVSDLGVPVRSYDLRVDSAVVGSITPGNAGANQTWDFLALHSTLATRHIDIINSNSGVMHDSFPLATIAYHADSLLNYNYFTNSSSGLLHYGIVSDYLHTNDSIKVVFSQPDTILKLPANYQDVCSSLVLGDSKSNCVYTFDTVISGFPVTVPIDTLRIKHTQYHISNIDAWGTMTTPTDFFPVLRQKNIVHTIDSIWGYANVPVPFQSYSGWYQIAIMTDTSQSYRWWMNGLGIPLVEMFMNKLSNTQVDKVIWVRNATTGIHENDLLSSGVYPNPANDIIKITNGAQYNQAIIYDVLGNVVKRQQITDKNEISVSTGNLPSGMYFFNLTGNKGNTSGKFVVKH